VKPDTGTVLQTERLVLRRFVPEDAEFILSLVNQPSFLRFVGDKGVRDLDGAREYLRNGPQASYEQNGYGLYLVLLRETGASLGMTGLVKRDWLDHPDIGFSFLPEYWSRGYAFESTRAVLAQARQTLGLERFYAIVSPDNRASIRLLEKLGFQYTSVVRAKEDGSQVKVYQLTEPSRSLRRFEPHAPHHTEELRGAPLASFPRRALGLIVDLAIAAVLFIPVTILVGWLLISLGVLDPDRDYVARLTFFSNWYSVLWLFVFLGLSNHFGNGRTLGKRMVGIRAVSLVRPRLRGWPAFERALAYGASALELGFGFIQYFMHPNRQTVHDRIAETIVIDERARGAG
jgi:[ribosomal protein S5]-alanine N-acetyltransferase